MNFLPLSRRHRGFRECYRQLPRLDFLPSSGAHGLSVTFEYFAFPLQGPNQKLLTNQNERYAEICLQSLSRILPNAMGLGFLQWREASLTADKGFIIRTRGAKLTDYLCTHFRLRCKDTDKTWLSQPN